MLIDLIREKFKSTGERPVQGTFFNNEGCCALGVLLKGHGRSSHQLNATAPGLIGVMIKELHGIELSYQEVQDVIAGWDSYSPPASPEQAVYYNLRKEIECQLSST